MQYIFCSNLKTIHYDHSTNDNNKDDGDWKKK